jgi:hypothetical protein
MTALTPHALCSLIESSTARRAAKVSRLCGATAKNGTKKEAFGGTSRDTIGQATARMRSAVSLRVTSNSKHRLRRRSRKSRQLCPADLGARFNTRRGFQFYVGPKKRPDARGWKYDCAGRLTLGQAGAKGGGDGPGFSFDPRAVSVARSYRGVTLPVQPRKAPSTAVIGRSAISRLATYWPGSAQPPSVRSRFPRSS